MSEQQATPGTFLSFRLNQETYGITIDQVREIVECDSTITPVPRTPEFMRGVMNLRGNVVPVVDMNRKLGLPSTEATPDTCIVIVEVEGGTDDGPLVLGVMVDGVEEVLELGAQDILTAPPSGTTLRPEFLDGLARGAGDGFIMLIRVDAVLAPDELSGVASAQARAVAAPAP